MQDFQVENGKPIYNLQQFLRIIAQANGRELTLIPDGIYGVQTEAAVIEFQRDNGLSPTGEVDNDTWDKIIEEYSRVVVYILPPPCTSLFPSGSHVIRVGDKAAFHYPIQAIILAIAKKLDNIDEFEISDTHTGDVVETTRQLQRLLESDCDGEIDVNCWRELSRLYENLVSKDTFRLDSANKDNRTRNADQNQRNMQMPMASFPERFIGAQELRQDIMRQQDMYSPSSVERESAFTPRLEPYNIRGEGANETTLPTMPQKQTQIPTMPSQRQTDMQPLANLPQQPMNIQPPPMMMRQQTENMQRQNFVRPMMPGQMQNATGQFGQNAPQIPTVEEQNVRRSESDRVNNATDMENNVVPNKVNMENNNTKAPTGRTDTVQNQNNRTKKEPLRWDFR